MYSFKVYLVTAVEFCFAPAGDTMHVHAHCTHSINRNGLFHNIIVHPY